MSDARIGRVVVASLHQAIADALPTRLEFYESWLSAAGLRAGTVWINGSSKHFPGFGFAGQKDSGLGQEETLEELVSFTQLKAVHYFGAEGRKNVEIL